MSKTIDKVSNINHPTLDVLKDYFDNFSRHIFDFPSSVMIYTLYKKDNLGRYDYNSVDNLYEGFLKMKVDEKIIDKIYEFLDYLKTIYDIDIIWLRFYNPKTYIDFHVDEESNKHSIPLTENERFFNYECIKQSYQNTIFYTKKLKEYSNDIDKFNEFFLNHDSENNRIVIMNTKSIYSFNFSLHSFFNGSNEKLRVNFIFEMEPGRYKKEDVLKNMETMNEK